MAQFAVHIATGIFSGNKNKSMDLKLALVVGNILPDLDFIPMLLLYPFSPQIALSFHRSFTHNIFFPLAIFLIFLLISKIKDDPKFINWGIGLSLGVVTHIILDIIFWFDQVKILWPLDVFGISTEIDLWKSLGVHASETAQLVVGPTLEFFMYGLFFIFAWQRVKNHSYHQSKDKPYFKRLIIISFAVYLLLLLSIIFLSPKSVVEISYGLGGLIMGPIALFTVWKYRNQILLLQN